MCRRSLIPQMPLVERDVVLSQKRPELILKRRLAVVFLLAGDVACDFLEFGIAGGERAIAVLPGEPGEFRKGFVYPPGGVRLDRLQGFRDGDSLGMPTSRWT